jgi:hypothetical protein
VRGLQHRRAAGDAGGLQGRCRQGWIAALSKKPLTRPMAVVRAFKQPITDLSVSRR